MSKPATPKAPRPPLVVTHVYPVNQSPEERQAILGRVVQIILTGGRK